MTAEQAYFIKRYVESLDQGTAAMFAGAGLSRAAGYVDWPGLLQPIAAELGLDVKKESDLVAVAQYHLNQNSNQKIRLKQRILTEFTRHTQLSPSHSAMVRLPITTFWTTNFDDLLEQALQANNKIVHVRRSASDLPLTISDREAVVYKMHGDLTRLEDVILTTEDFERYRLTHRPFINQLQADLSTKNFLFVGFSFNDPNLRYVLATIRTLMNGEAQEHFALFRRVQPSDFVDKADYDYESRRQKLWADDLVRYGIQAVFIDDYAEIPTLFDRIEELYYRRNIFVSGSASHFGEFGEERLERMCRRLGQEIIKRGYNLVSGFGLNVGSWVVMGALEQLYQRPNPQIEKRLTLRPFPQAVPEGQPEAVFRKKYRTDMISRCGFSIFIAGNTTNQEVAQGVIEEFNITHELNRYPLPIGATGFTTSTLWATVQSDVRKYFPKGLPEEAFHQLGDAALDDDTLVKSIFEIVADLSPR